MSLAHVLLPNGDRGDACESTLVTSRRRQPEASSGRGALAVDRGFDVARLACSRAVGHGRSTSLRRRSALTYIDELTSLPAPSAIAPLSHRVTTACGGAPIGRC